MAPLNNILKWTETLPSWQRDACRRLFQKETGLEEADYSDLYILLKMENGIEAEDTVESVPLDNEHLPAELVPGDTVTLVALRELENVNQIPNDHKLPFSESGMTVIYGGNGSGKSGYARVMKKACRARDQSEPIHPNANDPKAATKEPTAKFDVKVGGISEEVKWSRNAPSPNCFSKVFVFDSKYARSYITAEKDVAYLPYGLDIVENLANQILPKTSEKLEAEIAGINVNKLPFDHLLGETVVGKVIENLSVKSDVDEITSLGTFTEDDTKRIAELETALKESNPQAKAEESRLSAMRLETYAEKLTRSLVWVSVEAVEKFQKLNDEKNTAEAAEKKAADALRAGEELLPGTGDQAWKLLFEAARRYSTEAAYPGEEFPPSSEGKVCPLCQEDLPETGSQRINIAENKISYMHFATLEHEQIGEKSGRWMEMFVETVDESDNPVEVATRILAIEGDNGPENVVTVIVQPSGLPPFIVPDRILNAEDSAQSKMKHVSVDSGSIMAKLYAMNGRSLKAYQIMGQDAEGHRISATVSGQVAPLGLVEAETGNLSCSFLISELMHKPVSMEHQCIFISGSPG